MAKQKKRTGVSQAEALRVQQRIDELVRVRLDGAAFWDVREFVREKEAEEGSPWKRSNSAKLLSDAQLRRYVKRADGIIERSGSLKRSKRISRHIARLEHLYGKSVLAGDLRTALACLAEIARLKRMYPPTRTELTGKDGGPLEFRNLTDADLDASLAETQTKLHEAQARYLAFANGEAAPPAFVDSQPGAASVGTPEPG